MQLQTYLTLLGAALLVAHLKGVDSFTLGRLSSGDADRGSSLESVAKARNQSLSEDSNEEADSRDSSEEEEGEKEEDSIVKRSAQFAQFSRNSDELDDDSFELNDRRTFQPNVRPQAPQTANIRNFVFRNSNERDDISNEVRFTLATPSNTRITPTRTSTLPDRLPVPISLRNRNQPTRRFDDDDSFEIVRIISTPTQQTAPVRTTALPNRLPVPVNSRTQILRQTIDFDDDSIEIRDRVTAPIQQTISTQTGAVNRVVNTRRPSIFGQSDERDDTSIEVISFNQNGRIQTAIRPVQQTNNRVQFMQNVRQANGVATPQAPSLPAVVNQAPTTLTGINLVFTDSDERDDFSDEVIRSSLAAFATPFTATPPPRLVTLSSRLPASTGLRNQNIRPSNVNANRVTVTSAPVSRVVPTQTANQGVPNRTVNQAAPIQRVNRIVPTQTVIQRARSQTANRIIPVQTINQAAPIQTVGRTVVTQSVNQAAPIQTVNQVVPSQTINRFVSAQTVNQGARIQTANRIIPVQTINQAAPIQTVGRTVATQSVNQAAPIQTVNQVVPSQTINRFVPVQTVSRIVATPTVNRVFPTFNLPDRLPVPMGFRNLILRQTIDLDDDSVEIRDGTVFSPFNTNNRQGQTLTSVRRPVLSQDDDDISVELELVSTIQNQQVASPGSVQTTGNQGQRFVQRFDDDFSLEDDRDDDFNESSFFLEDQLNSADSFRFLATDFLLQPSTRGAPSVRSISKVEQTKDYDEDYSLETELSATHSDETNLSESPVKESDDWFLVKQYMNHDYSSEELEGQLAKEYFWQPVKDSSKKTA